jgi:hypothetical protein
MGDEVKEAPAIDLSSAMAKAVTERYAVVDDFLPQDQALAMRAEIDAHFSNPYQHKADTHQVWNYWYVPGAYTFMRTAPENVIEQPKVQSFIDQLTKWTISSLGLGDVTWPYLSFYVNGCSQTLHNDAPNGRFAYVYSLTKPQRKTIGGETIVVVEQDVFRQHLRKPTTLGGFSHAIEPRFNRLVIFDDRIVHGVERVAGSMDPVEGRFVLQGHISENGPIITGPLPYEMLQPPIQRFLEDFVREHGQAVYSFHGPISVRFVVGPDGTVGEFRVLLDRVTHLQPENSGQWQPLRDRYLAGLSRIRAPRAEGYTTVILPIMFSGPAAK